MKVTVIDDEAEMLYQIREYLIQFQKEYGEQIEFVTYGKPSLFFKDWDMEEDILILDVDMPEMNGFDVAKKVRERDQKVIIMFVTNMAQFAIRGYEVEAIDYVIKPLGYHDFAQKMKKAMRYLERDKEHKIILETTSGKQPIRISEIIYIEVVKHYLYFHTTNGTYEVRGAMREIEKQYYEKHFRRCSQSYLVNLAHVKAINGNEVMLTEKELLISRNRKNEFIHAFTCYVGGIEE